MCCDGIIQFMSSSEQYRWLELVTTTPQNSTNHGTMIKLMSRICGQSVHVIYIID